MNQSRRILITGLSSYWGGRLAQRLEQEAEVEAIVGVDVTDPRHELDRTEFVRVDTDDTLLRRIVRAAAIDTVVDTRLIGDPILSGVRRAHEVNVLGTRSILAACSGSASPVRKLVFKSSADYYGAEPGDPAFFTEEMTRRHAPRTAIEQDVVEAEQAVAEFAEANPDATVTILRFAAPVGADVRDSHMSLLGLPVVPAILGFDPRWQFIHEEDVVGALAHAVGHDLPGAYNAAADGVLALSEVVSLLGKPLLPVLPPWGTVFAAIQLRRLGLRVPVEMLRDLRWGRGMDNRRLKASGYTFRYTSREAVQKLRAHQRLRPLLRSGAGSYRYEREVEEFLRWSPSVQAVEAAREAAAEGNGHDGSAGAAGRAGAGGGAGRAGAGGGAGRAGAGGGAGRRPLEGLTEGELLDLIPSLELEALEQLRQYEAETTGRRRVLDALERQLARRSRAGAG
jgi:UDP-glucose 4-epimerase